MSWAMPLGEENVAVEPEPSVLPRRVADPARVETVPALVIRRSVAFPVSETASSPVAVPTTPLGSLTTWRPALPIVQWVADKREEQQQ